MTLITTLTVSELIQRLQAEASKSSAGVETPVYLVDSDHAHDIRKVTFEDRSVLAAGGIHIRVGDNVRHEEPR